MSAPRPRVGVSQCLLGYEVRHDGGHKRDGFIVGVLGDYFEWVQVCPEVEVGMGTPREALRLERGDGEGARMITIRGRDDWTARLNAFSARRLGELEAERLRGFILKKGSPSCGMERVKVYDANGVPASAGRGLFAEALLRGFPNLPVEEEGRLCDPRLRENFIARVFAYHRWRDLAEEAGGAAEVVRFHARHKYLLLAHDPAAYRAMGRLVAEAGLLPREELLERYEQSLMAALRHPAPVRRHVNAMHHVMGFLKEALTAPQKRDLLHVIDEYRRGVVPLVTPLALLQHHLQGIERTWVHDQVYLEPYPRELGLRSHL